MPITHVTPILGVDDCKIYPITVDSENAFTLGTAVDVPGIKQVSLTLEIDEKELTGDEKTLAVSSKIKSVTVNSEYAKLSLDVLTALSGGSVTDTAATKATLRIGEKAIPTYFQLQMQIKGTDDIIGGDCHLIVYKAKATAIPINGTEGDYATCTFDAKGVFTNCKWGSTVNEARLVDVDLNSTAVNLSGVAYSSGQ